MRDTIKPKHKAPAPASSASISFELLAGACGLRLELFYGDIR